MKRLLQLAGVVLLACAHVLAQGVRVGDGQPALSTITVPGVSSNIIVALPNATISVCTAPANAVPCTNKATTFTDATLTGACPTSQQVVLAGTNQCVATTDARGNWGVWVAAGQYEYTITQDGVSSGPFPITAGGSTGGGVGGGAWGSITGTLSSQTDLQAALDAKANSANPDFSGIIGLDPTTPLKAILFNDGGNIGAHAGFEFDSVTGQVTYPSTFAVSSTWPGSPLASPGANQTLVGISNDGTFQVCKGTDPCFIPGVVTSFPAGTSSTPGFPATGHPEIGLSAVVSQRSFTITNVARTSNTVTITVSTPTHALNWPVSGTVSIFNLPSPFDVLNCSVCVLLSVTGGTPTSTFTYTLNGTDVVSSATSGNAAIYGMYLVGYEQEFGRLVSNTANPAHRGSIALAKNDDAWHRKIDNSADLLLWAGCNDQICLGDTSTGVFINGWASGAEVAAPSNRASSSEFNLFVDSGTGALTCKLGPGGTNCMPAGSGTVTNTGTLTAHFPMLGNGGADSKVISSLGSAGQYFRSGGAGVDPAFAAIAESEVTNLTTDLAVKVPTSRTISTTAPLTGGGDLSANRTLDISNFGGDSGSGGTKGTVPAPAAGDAAAGKFLKADGTWSVPAGGGGSGSKLLHYDFFASPVTGTGSAINLTSFTVPGGTMGANDCLRAIIVWNHSTGTASVTYSWAFGATSPSGVSSTNTGNGTSTFIVCNKAATNAQTMDMFNTVANSTNLQAQTSNSGAEDTTGSVDIAFKFSVANTDQVTMRLFTVELLH